MDVVKLVYFCDKMNHIYQIMKQWRLLGNIYFYKYTRLEYHDYNQVTCGPGHGISVESLGKYQSEEPVSRIRVTGATLSNTDNGVRIKTWPASSSGVASDILFKDVVMNNVANPIIIDQNYCPNSQCSNRVIINITNIYTNFDVKKIVKLLILNSWVRFFVLFSVSL